MFLYVFFQLFALIGTKNIECKEVKKYPRNNAAIGQETLQARRGDRLARNVATEPHQRSKLQFVLGMT